MLTECKISPSVKLHNLLWAQRLKTLIRNYPNLTITFPTNVTIWRCTGNLFNISLKFKMAATNQLYCAAETQTLWEISQILQSNSPRYGEVQVIFKKYRILELISRLQQFFRKLGKISTAMSRLPNNFLVKLRPCHHDIYKTDKN